ncbi:hypothetical protein L2E82_40418 [Cichorium intybus]|uniref:Uncharacterized protein n=1 Tax=Cichorium intybus TaxID=13427 RepID=A0ACB9AL32_CICIN|nr:hypothetical protein L2E82_40418 [Cichorium intybus]
MKQRKQQWVVGCRSSGYTRNWAQKEIRQDVCEIVGVEGDFFEEGEVNQGGYNQTLGLGYVFVISSSHRSSHYPHHCCRPGFGLYTKQCGTKHQEGTSLGRQVQECGGIGHHYPSTF